MKIAVIPARGGSKRIPRKNIKVFAGKPIIAWSIEAAKKSGCFDRIIVSTEDNEIAEVSKLYGAEVPFLRPQNLSGDHIETTPVIVHAIEWEQQQGRVITDVCCIYATAPFLRSEDLQKGLDILEHTDCNFAFSVTKYRFPIQRAIRITNEQRIEMFDKSQFNKRSQDLEEAFHDAGQFYWGHAKTWLSGAPMFSSQAGPVYLPRHRVQDIDDLEDWEDAERMFHSYNYKTKVHSSEWEGSHANWKLCK